MGGGFLRGDGGFGGNLIGWLGDEGGASCGGGGVQPRECVCAAGATARRRIDAAGFGSSKIDLGLERHTGREGRVGEVWQWKRYFGLRNAMRGF